MRIKAVLWKYDPRQDGSCSIKIYANVNGKKKYFKTKLAVFPNEFDEKAGEVKRVHPSHSLYNSAIRTQIRTLEDHFLKGGDFNTLKKGKPASLIPFLTEFIQDAEAGAIGITQSTTKNYKSTLTRLKQFSDLRNQEFTFNNVDLDFYDDFKRFLLNEGKCKIPGFNKHIKILKAIMRLALDKGLHNNTAFQHKLFKKITVKTNKIFLTVEEIEQIENLDLFDRPGLARERDRFLVSYYFLTRYSDSIRIRREDFFKREEQFYLRYLQLKTNKECILPVKAKALRILESRGFDLSGDTNQEANRKLKSIAAMAGINTIVNEGDRSGPKSLFVTTHTARRSAATHLALQGVNLKIIADLGGWEKVETLKTYLRSSGLDSAEVAKDLDFFK